ncbi:hypothetical protein PBCV1_a106R [Paramecium bursaria Chlorella virus 1]|uniref:Uncharacterized protein n=1 Tax=Paramecium bursaria Chlorella virus 1 TaxID=10506 RepID=Q84427_PBCV1|nr:hypothetical protein PBCV1_a106R [Paramecium bursaria Chlorella virus 1]AAC96474.1 hypothetical protein [Paramecium bursaria Chlorella virus 1]
MFVSRMNQNSKEIIIHVRNSQTRIIVDKFFRSGFLENYRKNHRQSSEFPFEVSVTKIFVNSRIYRIANVECESSEMFVCDTSVVILFSLSEKDVAQKTIPCNFNVLFPRVDVTTFERYRVIRVERFGDERCF